MGRNEGRTYRVRQLPHHVDRHQAVRLLVSLEPSLGPETNIRIWSLASSFNAFERPRTKTATISFESLPAIFDNGKDQWTLTAINKGHEQNVIVDVHFLDFTVFNDPDPQSHSVDCIAISGLASHSFGSWKCRGESDFMWLRDQLPKDLPELRSIIYGYDTKLFMSESFQTIDDIAITLVHKLKSLGRSTPSAKPLIFLAHSLGGILIKRVLANLANGDEDLKFIIDSVTGIISFGVPGQGMQTSHLLAMVKEQPNEAFIRLLDLNSTYLNDLDKQFSNIMMSRNIRLISVYETRLSATTQDSSSGQWTQTGPATILVSQASATQKQSRREDILPIDKNHSDMVKFAESDFHYRDILAYLNKLCEVASLSSAHDKRFEKRYGGSKFEKEQLLDPGKSTRRQLSSYSQSNGTQQDTDQLGRPHDLEVDSLELSEKEILANIMVGIDLPETDRRLNEIDNAYQATFDWVFESNDLAFADWLRHGRGIYWISGKPGSGKSTLMKYIWWDARALALLRHRHSEEHIAASFFFHDRGTHLQKSMEGLLRSILAQVLSQSAQLQKIVLPICKELKRPLYGAWLLPDLEEVFATVLEQNKYPVHITLFLDALDEYDGAKDMLASFIHTIVQARVTSATRFQVCFSSRPWDDLRRSFEACPGIKIHEHTQDDIYKYTFGKLASVLNPIQSLSPAEQNRSQNFRSLVWEIVERAQGVFLWVKLIVSMLKATEVVSLGGLREMLLSLPDDLEKLYERIVERIPSVHRREAYIIFEILLRAETRLEVFELDIAVACALHDTIDKCLSTIPSNRPSADDLDIMGRRLRDRCGFLIDIVIVEEETGSIPVVQFMHQTVKEFVNRPGFQQYIVGRNQSVETQNGHTFIGKYFLSLMICGKHDFHRARPGYFRTECQLQFYLAERSTGASLRSFLDQIGDKQTAYCFSLGESRNKMRRIMGHVAWVTSFAVTANLQIYMKEKLKEISYAQVDPSGALLHLVAEDVYAVDYEGLPDDFRDLSYMCRLLLNHGADLSATLECDGKIPFDVLFSYPSIPSSPGWLGILDVFLQYGQSPERKLPTDPRLSNMWLPIHVAIYERGDFAIAVVKILLKHNVNVNALDADRRTALDSMITNSDYDMAMLLLQHGGCVTTKRHAKPLIILDKLREIYELAPQLQENPLQKAHGVLHKVGKKLLGKGQRH